MEKFFNKNQVQMISKDCLTFQWINEVSKKNNNADKTLIEKAIRALFLVEGLAKF